MKKAAFIINWIMAGLFVLSGLIALIIIYTSYEAYYSSGRGAIKFVLYVFAVLAASGLVIGMNALIMKKANTGHYVAAGTISFFFGFPLSTIYLFLLPLYEKKYAPENPTRQIAKKGEVVFSKYNLNLNGLRISKDAPLYIENVYPDGKIQVLYTDPEKQLHHFLMREKDVE